MYTEYIHLDVLFVLDDILRNLEPKLLPQLVIVLRHIRIDLRQLEIILLERKVDAAFVQPHLGVYMHAWLGPPRLLAQTQCIVEVIIRPASERI